MAPSSGPVGTGCGKGPAIAASGLRAGYAERVVLHDIEMAARAGEMVGLVGPNGAGKSTLLKTLSGVVPLIGGSVRVLGRDLAHFGARDLARVLAYVPQSEPTLFDFTVREVVLMGRHPHHGKASETRSSSGGRLHGIAAHAIAANAMAATDILHLADRPVTALSGGEHRRVILARAIAQTPLIMLLDEPTAHLDIAHQSETLRLISEMTRTQGLCAIAALHDLNVAAEWCDRLILLANGRILADGPPATVLAGSSLQEAYGIPFRLAANPVTARPLVMPMLPNRESVAPDAPHVHVICGGGTGAGIMAELSRAGYRLTVGVLNQCDTDEGAAEGLGITAATVEPFSPISDASYRQALELGAGADVIVVAPIPLGRGNVRNIELAAALAEQGGRIVIVNDPPIEARDFTDGTGARMWSDLVRRAAAVLTSEESIAAAVRRIAGDPFSGTQPADPTQHDAERPIATAT